MLSVRVETKDVLERAKDYFEYYDYDEDLDAGGLQDFDWFKNNFDAVNCLFEDIEEVFVKLTDEQWKKVYEIYRDFGEPLLNIALKKEKVRELIYKYAVEVAKEYRIELNDDIWQGFI